MALSIELKKISVDSTDPAGRPVTVVSEAKCLKLSEESGRTLGEIYREALKAGICPYRYLRNRDSITLKEQLILAGATVTVTGAGGLGGYVLQILARMGIGGLIVFDPDRFDETNLNRQLFCTSNSLGAFKADVASETITAVNPAVTVFSHRRKFHPEKDAWLIKRSAVIVDALDNVKDRRSLDKMAGRLGIPLVHGAITGFEGRLMTVFPGESALGSIYPADDHEKSAPMAEHLMGVPAISPCITGTLQAMEAVKIILKRGRLLKNTLLHLSLETPSMEKFQML